MAVVDQIAVFALFDQVLLLSEGRLIFFGPTADMVAYFSAPDLGYKYQEGQNPAEFMIDVSNGQVNPGKSHSPRCAQELEELYRNSRCNKLPSSTSGIQVVSVT